MARSLGQSKRLYRKRSFAGISKWFGIAIVLGVVIIYAYQSGKRFVEAELAESRAEVVRLRDQIDAAEADKEAAVAALAEAEARAETAETRLEAYAGAPVPITALIPEGDPESPDTPQGEAMSLAEATATIERLQVEHASLVEALDIETQTNEDLRGQLETLGGGLSDAEKALLERVRDKRATGVAYSQINGAIDGLTKPAPRVERVCDLPPITRRFVVRTPLYKGGSDNVTFENNKMTVTATGTSARDEEGRLQAWFTPSEPVSVVFRHANGHVSQATGRLPMTHTVTIDGVREEFRITAGTVGFVNVTGGRCHQRGD